MKKVLFDTNIILDIALQRKPFVENSLKAVHCIGTKIIGYVNVLTLVNTFYFAKKEIGIEKAREFISDMLTFFEVVNTNKQICLSAIQSDFKDFEDAIQEVSARHSGVDIIVTRNSKDFENSKIQVFEPWQFLEWINATDSLPFD